MEHNRKSMIENKHAVFLKPIRDLADTWNINIASELEDYLQVKLFIFFLKTACVRIQCRHPPGQDIHTG